ncbi:MAG: hypothetical protein JJT89_05975 [Nitriliruptoraceae bacterium]|nr:hypothetical protein [Nitriliruptoraceae bacterium]
MGQRTAARRRGVVGRAAVAVAAVVAARGVVRGARGLGAHPLEVWAAWPGDEVVSPRAHVSTHAVTIAAAPERIWPWLVQMGHHRGGWYAADRLEALMGAGDFATGRSARRIEPALQQLGPGDRMPLSDGLDLIAIRVDAPRTLVLALADAPLDWVWSFHLVADTPSGGRSRLVVRTRVDTDRWWLRPLLAPLDVGHAVMQTVQLWRIRARAEGRTRHG